MILAANIFKNTIWYQYCKLCYKREMHGTHNLYFSCLCIWSGAQYWRLGFLVWFGVFCKRAVLAFAVLLAEVPFSCCKSWSLPAHIHIFISLWHFFFSHFKLPPPISALDFQLFQNLYSLCILFNCLNKRRIKRKSTAVYFLYSRRFSQTMSGLWHLIALIKS